MQSPSIQDFPLNSKRRLELQNQHNSQLQQLQQQQQQQQNYDDDMILDEEPPFKKQRPGVATNFLYKFTELVYYTSAFASDAINTITGNQGGNERRQLTRQSIYVDDDDVLRVNPEDEEDEEIVSYDQKLDKKVDSAWAENADEEEPPPPYDSSWSMPSPSTNNVKIPEMNQLTTPALSSTSSQEFEFEAPQQPPSTLQQITTKSTTNITTPRRRQFRVRRGRRFLRRKSSSVDMSSNVNSSSTQPEDDDDIFLKFNCKLADMIAEGKAALTSKVDVTDVEIMLAEEKEREQRIMRELGIQTPINRRARRLTSSSSTSSDYEYYSSLLGSGGHSNQSSISLCDNGFGGGYTSIDTTSRPVVGRTSPTQYESPGFNSPFGYSNGYGLPSTGSPTTSGYDGGFGRYGSNSGFSSNGMYNNRY